MSKWEQTSDTLQERTEPRARTKVVQESYNKMFSIVVRESTLQDLSDITAYEGYKSRNALINHILETYIDDYYGKKGD